MSGQGGSKQKRASAWEIARGGEGNERDKSDQVTTSHLLPSSNLPEPQITQKWTMSTTECLLKGSLQIEFLEKFGNLAQMRGGGLRIPNFYPIFPEQTLLC